MEFTISDFVKLLPKMVYGCPFKFNWQNVVKNQGSGFYPFSSFSQNFNFWDFSLTLQIFKNLICHRFYYSPFFKNVLDKIIWPKNVKNCPFQQRYYFVNSRGNFLGQMILSSILLKLVIWSGFCSVFSHVSI